MKVFDKVFDGRVHTRGMAFKALCLYLTMASQFCSNDKIRRRRNKDFGKPTGAIKASFQTKYLHICSKNIFKDPFCLKLYCLIGLLILLQC
jgi:hypothetical protein